jgi:hypothetical protein
MLSKLKKKEITKKNINSIYDNILKSFKKKENKKKKTYKEIENTLYISNILKDYIIRNKENWTSKSFNLQKQQKSYIDHLFLKYKVPRCFYRMFEKEHICADIGIKEIWFIAIAQGWSFRKESKMFLNKKEAHIFCNSDYRTFTKNFWYSKCVYIGININLFKWLYNKHFYKIRINLLRNKTTKEFYREFLLFFYKFQQYLDQNTVDDLIDYIVAAKTENENYSLKGRTIDSLIAQSNRWHRNIQKQNKIKKYSWVGINIDTFSIKKNKIKWEIIQILTSKELYKEGKTQGHCVFSYIDDCSNGISAIFSLRQKNEFESKICVTIEVRHKRIVQKRRKYNGRPTKEEDNIIHLWAIKNNLNWS